MTAPVHPSCHVLVVDDDPGICALMEVTFSLDARFDLVAVAHSAAEAGEHCRKATAANPIDLVLLDVTLPDGDGIDVLRDLRVQLPGARFALFTGWSDDDATIARASDAGADALFRKDMSPSALLDDLDRLSSAPPHCGTAIA